MTQAAIAPIGGFPTSADIPPTIVFLILYTLLIPAGFYRIVKPKTRNVVQLPITAFIIERILNLTVRLMQAAGKWNPSSPALLEYQQIALGWGWIALAQSMVAFWRSIACNATRPDLDAGRLDDKPLRKRVKAVTYGLDAGLWIAQLLGVGVGIYWRLGYGADDPAVFEARILAFRIASTVIGFVFVLLCIGGIFWTRARLPAMNPTACNYLVTIYLFLLIIPIYRITQFPTPGRSKPVFYVLHLTPEWLVAAIVICADTRKIFGTGAWGDAYFSWRKGWRPYPFRRRRPRSQPLVRTMDQRWSRMSNDSQETFSSSDYYTDETEGLMQRPSGDHPSSVRRPQHAYPVTRTYRSMDIVRPQWLKFKPKEHREPIMPKAHLPLASDSPPQSSTAVPMIYDSHSASCF